MTTPADFEIQAMSDPDHEALIVEVLYRGEFCLLVTHEQGVESMRVEIQPRAGGQPWDFRMEDVQAVLARAAERLYELRRVP